MDYHTIFFLKTINKFYRTIMSYTKLSDLVNDRFTVQEVLGFGYKKWDEVQETMLFSKDYVEGYRKVWGVETDKGKLDLGSGQMATLLEKVCFKGTSELVGKTFDVKTNGKTGMDVRYYFNPVKTEQVPPPYTKEETSGATDDLPW